MNKPNEPIAPPNKPTESPHEHSGVQGKPKYDPSSGFTEPALGTLSPPTPEGPDIVLGAVDYLGSYNWVDSEDPTIVVPGQ